MHDPQYRVEVARQQTTYNQPSDVGFYLASDTDYTQVPVPSYYAPGSIDALRDATKAQIAAGAVKGVAAAGLLAAVEVADKAADAGNEKLAVKSLKAYVELLTPRTRLSTVTRTTDEQVEPAPVGKAFVSVTTRRRPDVAGRLPCAAARALPATGSASTRTSPLPNSGRRLATACRTCSTSPGGGSLRGRSSAALA